MSNESDTPVISDGISLHHLMMQCALMAAIFYLWSSPLIQPAKIMVVLFHEMSHGLMAIITGGKVLSIEVTQDEGGACETEGGWPLMIVSAGYLGSMLFGGIVLYLSRFRELVPLVFGMLTLVVVSAILTVLDGSFSRGFAAGLAAVFIVLGFVAPTVFASFALRVLGTVACLYSIFDIYWDVLADRGTATLQNDAVVFSSMSGIDARSVGLGWLVVSVIFFLFILRMSMISDDESEDAPASS